MPEAIPSEIKANGVGKSDKTTSTTEAWLETLAAAERPLQPVILALPMPAADELQVLTSLAEVRQTTAAVIATGQRLISIFTPDLEPQLYDDPRVIEVIKRFVLSHSFAKVRVLLRDHTRHTGSGSRFMSMARRLTSYLELRILVPQFHHLTASYCIADDRGIVYRMHSDRWDGIGAVNSPPVARQYLQDFDAAWLASHDQHHRRAARMQ
jgi:hypothetical protein